MHTLLFFGVNTWDPTAFFEGQQAFFREEKEIKPIIEVSEFMSNGMDNLQVPSVLCFLFTRKKRVDQNMIIFPSTRTISDFWGNFYHFFRIKDFLS